MTRNVTSIHSKLNKRSSNKAIELFKVDRDYVLKPYLILLTEGFSSVFCVNVLSLNVREFNRVDLSKVELNSVQLEIEGSVNNIILFETKIISAIASFFRDCDDYRCITKGELSDDQMDEVFINSIIDCFAIGWIAAIHKACVSQLNENVHSSMTPRQLLNELGIGILNTQQTTAICRGYDFGQVYIDRQQLSDEGDGAA